MFVSGIAFGKEGKSIVIFEMSTVMGLAWFWPEKGPRISLTAEASFALSPDGVNFAGGLVNGTIKISSLKGKVKKILK